MLAFADLSQAKDQEYFSDGVAEEILNALAKIEDLKVAGRTSSFYFKGRNETLAAIGSTLGVAHVLEGSVRKHGSQLRISAKLLRVSDGVEMWADSFDGTDADIFALQGTIAHQVTSELQADWSMSAPAILTPTRNTCVPRMCSTAAIRQATRRLSQHWSKRCSRTRSSPARTLDWPPLVRTREFERVGSL